MLAPTPCCSSAFTPLLGTTAENLNLPCVQRQCVIFLLSHTKGGGIRGTERVETKIARWCIRQIVQRGPPEKSGVGRQSVENSLTCARGGVRIWHCFGAKMLFVSPCLCAIIRAIPEEADDAHLGVLTYWIPCRNLSMSSAFVFGG